MPIYGEQGMIQPGDTVVLVMGPYQGSFGVLLRWKEDANWVEVREWDGRIRSHPILWLRRRPHPHLVVRGV